MTVDTRFEVAASPAETYTERIVVPATTARPRQAPPPPVDAQLAVPMADLALQFARLREELAPTLAAVAQSGQYVLGPRVREFEEAFAAYLGVEACVAVNSGTSALHLALLAAGVGPGDEVVTSPMTFVATAWAISYTGARPVFADVDPQTYTLDPEQVERRLTPRTRAIVPVHLYGQPAAMAELLDLADRRRIAVIEDAAQAHGAEYRGRKAGSLGRCGCFSFYPSKNLGALGEGGAVVTDDERLAKRLRALRDQGQSARHEHDELGFNYRMDAFQGAALRIKLRHLDGWNAARRLLAARYSKLLADLPLTLPEEAPGRLHVWHLYVLLHPERERLRRELDRRGVSTGLHYPIPVHLQKAYRHLGHRPGDFPVAERVARECLSLPLYPELTASQQERVIDALHEAMAAMAP